jgi:hypothetical protein
MAFFACATDRIKTAVVAAAILGFAPGTTFIKWDDKGHAHLAGVCYRPGHFWPAIGQHGL